MKVLRLKELMRAAASARLCVETVFRLFGDGGCTQPPPRGCVLKPLNDVTEEQIKAQPPPRGCVLKLAVGTQNLLSSGSRLRAAAC